jgi:phosphorylcholine metabolism protein LicD
VNYTLIANKSSITQIDIKGFIPTRDDIDIMYTNNPDEQLVVTDNTITSSINGLTIEWNQNTRTDKVKDQTLVFNRI